MCGKGIRSIMDKVLSVSIAAYNIVNTIDECLKPFMESEVIDKLDIMIVNDGSKDGIEEVALKYTNAFPDSIRLINKENGGWGSTLNTGMQYARGKYFKNLDGDDYFSPVTMTRFIEALEATDADMVVSTYVSFDDVSGKVTAIDDCNPGYEYNRIYELKEINNFCPYMHSVTAKTELIRGRVNITEHCFYTDTEYVLKVCNCVNTVEFLDFPVYYYRRASVGQSMSLTGLEKHYKEQCRVVEICIDYMNEQVTRSEVKAVFDNMLKNTCTWAYMILLYITPNKEHKEALVGFYNMLRKKAPKYDEAVHFGEIDILRKMNFLFYHHFATKKRRRDNIFSEDGRLAK